METPFAPLKIQIAYLNSMTPKALLFTGKNSRCLVHNWNQCNFVLFLPKFGCHSNSLCSLESSDSTFEFADPENPYHTHKKCLDILYRSLEEVQKLHRSTEVMPIW